MNNREIITLKLLATLPGGLGGALIMSVMFEETLPWILYSTWFFLAAILTAYFYSRKEEP